MAVLALVSRRGFQKGSWMETRAAGISDWEGMFLTIRGQALSFIVEY
jgi:hypothetical protein